MTSTTAEFFDALSRRGFEPLLADITATARFDVVDGNRVDRWQVVIDKGEITVVPGSGDAACVLAADRPVFDGIVEGRVNPMAALLRGELTVSGDPELLVACQRLFLETTGTRERQPSTIQGS